MKELVLIQQGLKAPKGQFNSFGKYHYRSCEDILEAVKPLLWEHNCSLVLSDEVCSIDGRFYIRATATLTNASGGQVFATAYAREQDSKSGMDASQLTGSTSSYARKYALNGLFCIDDTKDADTMDNTNEGKASAPAPKKEDDRPWLSENQLNSALNRINAGRLDTVDMIAASFRMKKEYKERLENAAHEYKVQHNLL